MSSLKAENLSTEETIKKYQELERRKKQQFLINEIQQQDYDVNDFVRFLISKKGKQYLGNKYGIVDDDVMEIDNWALDELQEAVQEFKQSHQPKVINQIYYEGQNGIDGQANDQENNPNQDFGFGAQQAQEQDEFTQFLGGKRITVIESIDGEDSIMLKAISSTFKLYEKTNMIVKTTLNHNSIDCEVFEIQFINSGILKSQNQKIQLRIRMELQDSLEKYEVKRTFDDLIMLRKFLIKKYPYYLVPPLLEKVKLNKLQITQRFSQRFLRSLLTSEIFRAEPELFNFLTKDSKVSKDLKKRLKEKPMEMGLFNIYTEEGMVKIQTDIMSAIFCSKYPEFLQTYRDLFDNMFLSMKQIKQMGKILGYLYTHLSALILKINSIHEKVIMLEEDFALRNVGNGLKSLGTYFNCMADVFYQNLRKDLQYTAMLSEQSYQELWDFRLKFKDEFLNLSNNLEKKKEKLFSKGNIDKWGIKDQVFKEQNREALQTDFKFALPYMLHEETDKMERVKLVFQFFTNQVFNEVSKEQEKQYTEICKIFVKMAMKMKMAETDLISEWSDITFRCQAEESKQDFEYQFNHKRSTVLNQTEILVSEEKEDKIVKQELEEFKEEEYKVIQIESKKHNKEAQEQSKDKDTLVHKDKENEMEIQQKDEKQIEEMKDEPVNVIVVQEKEDEEKDKDQSKDQDKQKIDEHDINHQEIQQVDVQENENNKVQSNEIKQELVEEINKAIDQQDQK
ncbi:px domain containing protein [Stylonychia lemnae]|uniref:Px domain containing protein n=1 Tax=Stylonychia lemnae TaxID=5949 RepID=A0A077ZMJ3_STYLE|nr:px domain containing protein [Stylonychia lemnae]|eukprot:CDW71163.1 px domain containing protein [Stylonychia lemnae]